MTTYNNFSTVQALHAGGWRVTDREQLRTEYDLTPDELDDICEGLAAFEEERQHVKFLAACELMDDDLRESTHAALAPCSDHVFLAAYCAAHLAKYGAEFEF